MHAFPFVARSITRQASFVMTLLGVAVVSACVAPEQNGPHTTGSVTAPQPKMATYSCGEDGNIAVESLGTSVRVTGTDGVATDLPASPPTQTARFGGENQAIVVENGEALYMVMGKPTLTCRRAGA